MKVQHEYAKIDAVLSRGIACHDNGNLTRAIAIYRQALTIDETHSVSHFYLGCALQDNGEYQDAISAYRQAVEHEPGFQEAIYNIAVLLHGQGLIEDAIKEYEFLLCMNPDFVEGVNNLGAAYHSFEDYQKAVDCYCKVIELKPDHNGAYYNLGKAYLLLGSIDLSISAFQKSLSITPDRPEIFNDLGLAYHGNNNFSAALSCFHRAITLDPEFVEPYYNMGNTFLENNEPDLMIEWYQMALTLTPEDPIAHNNVGKMLQDRNRPVEAIALYRQALRLNPEYTEAQFNLAISLLQTGNFKEGWQAYECRLTKHNWQFAYPHRYSLPRWDGTPFNGKTLLVHCEQGYGDSIQFARYLPLLKALGGTVIFETHAPLMPLFTDFPGVDCLKVVSEKAIPETEFDLTVPLLSLPGIFGTIEKSIPADIPYVFAEPIKIKQWRHHLDCNRLKIGIVWAGNNMHINDKNRSCRLDHFLPLFEITGIQLYGLQKGDAVAQTRSFQYRNLLQNFGPALCNFQDTAALIDNLDIVIAVDTAVAHLAGAMGKPVWVLLPFASDWRWLQYRTDSPWYPTMRLFRQSEPGNWRGVFEQVTAELNQVLVNKTNDS